MKRIAKHLLLGLTALLFASVILSGCSVSMEDPVADEYLVEMLDAIRENDADAAYDFFVEGYVERDDMEKTVDTLSTLWTYDEYDYKLVYKGIKSTVGTHGTVTYNERKYTVTVGDDSYTVTLSYIDDEGLVGFHMQF
jgi:hypothetical protein